jgi:hypothetical protein
MLAPSLTARSRIARATAGGKFLTVIAVMIHPASSCLRVRRAAIPCPERRI